MANRQYNVFEAKTGCRDVEFVVVGLIANNVYFIEDGNGGVIVVDPGDNPDVLMGVVGDRPVSAIFVTHNHTDHTGALRALHDATGAPVYCSEIDAPVVEEGTTEFGLVSDPCPVDVRLHDGDTIVVGATTWRILHTPGHTKGGICFYLDPADAGPEAEGVPLLLSGDTLFHASMGRTDLPGGSERDMAASLKRLGELPDETLVLPGHNSPTTIGAERWRIIDFYPKWAGLE